MSNFNSSPINRNSKFIDEAEYEFHLEMGREYLEIIGDTIRIFNVSRNKTQLKKNYGEVSPEQIVLEKATDILGVIEIEAKEDKVFNSDNATLRYELYGNINCGLLVQDLKDLSVDINYGDFLGYRADENTVLYFQVVDDDKKYKFSGRRYAAFKPFWREIKGVPVDPAMNIDFLRNK